MFADIGGTQLYYETIGTGPTVLAMHGGLGLDHTYLRAHDALADAYRIVYYDHRANGQSPRGTTATLDHATWHADAAALLDHLGESRAIIYGHSYGSFLALGFALRYPERVRALVLCSTAPTLDYMALVQANLASRDPALAARLGQAMMAPPATDAELADVYRTCLPLYFHGAARPEAFAATRYRIEGYLAGAAALATYDVVPRLDELRAPTLVLQGADDFMTPVSQAQRIPAELIEFAASGHYPFLEEPAKYVAVLRDWLQRIAKA